MDKPETTPPPNFIRYMVEEDDRQVRRPGHYPLSPEPNGYLHIGHAKSICLNFGLAGDFNGYCNFRYDDTNPSKEEVEYVESIQADVRWLGFDWGDRLYYASDYYFDQIYDWAVQLIKAGKAFVCAIKPPHRAPKKLSPLSKAMTKPARPRSLWLSRWQSNRNPRRGRWSRPNPPSSAPGNWACGRVKWHKRAR